MATKDEIREARNRYAREYYRQHKDKHKERMERYWAKKAEAYKAQDEPATKED